MIRSLLTRRTLGGAAALIALAFGGASVAWACSTQPNVNASSGEAAGSHTSGPVGSQVTFTGRDFGPGPVQVRWNSRTGPLLAEAQGPNFTVPVTIPQARVGIHYIVAFQPVGTGTASLAFEVTRSPTTSTEPDAGGTTSTAAGGVGEQSSDSSSTEQATAQDSDPTTQTAGSSGQASESTGTGAAAERSEPAQVAAAQPARASSRASATSGSGATAADNPARAASANPAAVTTPSGQAVFGGSTATPVTDSGPSTATVSGDTWSGFAAEAKPSLLSDGPPTSTSAPASTPAVGIGLLGAGLVALFAGFAAAESARKRAVADAGGR